MTIDSRQMSSPPLCKAADWWSWTMQGNDRSLRRRGCLAGAASLPVKTLPGSCARPGDGQGAPGGPWRRPAPHELRRRPRRRRVPVTAGPPGHSLSVPANTLTVISSYVPL